MSRFKTHKKILLIALVFLGPLYVFAQGQERLAPGIKKLIYAEQQLLSRDVNEARIMTPKANHQEDQYKPENGQIFEVKSYWVDKEKLKTFESAFISPSMKQIFHKVENGKEKFLFLVHPESESLYQEFLKKTKSGPRFWATSTASSRTLLMWQEGQPEKAFFGKLSLNKSIGGVVRTIPQGEAARSVGTNEVLQINKSALPKSFQFLPETLSLIPNGFERGAMIIREIPQEIAAGKQYFIPLFSLYADRGEQRPLLAEMIEKSGMNPRDFVREKVIGPFIQQWMEMVLVHGIAMEPHAQNVLIGLNPQGLPNGQFLHRDFGGFNMDMNRFGELNTLLPAKLPQATTIQEDYHQNFSGKSVDQSLGVYFDHGFAYNLDQKLPVWVKNGWIPAYSGKAGEFSDMIYQRMTEEFPKLTKGQIRPTTWDLKNNNTNAWMIYARKVIGPMKKPLCSGLFF